MTFANSTAISTIAQIYCEGPCRKVKSSVLRLIKTAYLADGISMPDDARERVFLDGVTLQFRKETATSDKKKPESSPLAEDSKLITKAEGN